MVPTAGSRPRVMRAPSRSASALSPMPNVPSVRLAIAGAPAGRTAGRTSDSNMGIISRGGPGRQNTRQAPSVAAKPGAVPPRLRTMRADFGRRAWRRLMAAMGRPRPANHASRSVRATASSTCGAPASVRSLSASRVRSSSVGPRPPVEMRTSTDDASARIAAAMAARSSATVRCSTTSRPASRSAAESVRELVSSVVPSTSSSPTERMAARGAFTGRNLGSARSPRAGGCRSPRRRCGA